MSARVVGEIGPADAPKGMMDAVARGEARRDASHHRDGLALLYESFEGGYAAAIREMEDGKGRALIEWLTRYEIRTKGPVETLGAEGAAEEGLTPSSPGTPGTTD